MNEQKPRMTKWKICWTAQIIWPRPTPSDLRRDEVGHFLINVQRQLEHEWDGHLDTYDLIGVK